MMPHRILFVEASPELSFGGSKRVLVNLLGALDRGRYEPRVLFARQGTFVEAVRALGVTADIEPLLVPSSRRGHDDRQSTGETFRQRIGVHRRDDGEVERSSFREVLRGGRSYLHYHTRDRWLASRVADAIPHDTELLHINSPMHDQYVWSHVARTRQIPFVTHEHGIWRRPPAAFRRIAREAGAIFCLTEERVALIQRFCGTSVRAVLLPNGVDAERFRPSRPRREVREEFGVPDEVRLLITAGHIQRWKGQSLAVESANELATLGIGVVWLLCGRVLEPDFESELRTKIQEYGLGDRVRIVGERQDLPDLLAAADLSVHTSVEPEPFGMVLVESMVVGTPVVGPAEGAVPSILANGMAGRLYEPRDASDLSRVLRELLEDAPLRQRIATRGRERVMQSYTLESQVRLLESVYDGLLQQ
jgi:glycosyltransferase involved in cell wall biosynthesis